ncbi:hypothetical protein ABZ829_33370 [Streptomyces xanthochromogenes]|uniref:hypothetical protein n=1 Tax=Streptomyces xanthochromogenes TaxID=67384 RepID=UPI0034362A88
MPLTTPRRAALRTVAVTACLPYLCLKAAWIGGSHLGIPEHSGLRDHSSGMAAANTASILLDSCVIALALLLTRPWGLRVKTWLLALPMWVATGLLAPVMTGYPLQLLLHACGSAAGPAAPGSAPFLDTWVFAVVYAGFIVQGLALGTLFTLYARTAGDTCCAAGPANSRRAVPHRARRPSSRRCSRSFRPRRTSCGRRARGAA